MGWVGSVIWWVGWGLVDENRPTDNCGCSRYGHGFSVPDNAVCVCVCVCIGVCGFRSEASVCIFPRATLCIARSLLSSRVRHTPVLYRKG